MKKKGYVRLHTNRGDLNLELHCDMVGVGSPATGFLSCHWAAWGAPDSCLIWPWGCG